MHDRIKRPGGQFEEQWGPDRVARTSKTIIFVVVGGIMLGIFAAIANLYFIAFAIGVALVTILVAWKFEAALMVYTLVAFIPWGQTPDLAVGGSGVGKGLYVSQLMLGFLLAVWVVRYMLGAMPAKRIKTGFHTPVILYLVYSVINVMHSYIFWDPHVNQMHQHPQVNAVELALRFMSAFTFFMFATSITDKKWLKWCTFMVMVPGVYNILNLLANQILPVYSHWGSLVALLPMSFAWIALIDKDTKIGWRAVAAGFVLLSLFVVVYKSVGWVSGWLGLFASLGTVTLIKNKKVFIAGLAVFILVLAVAWPFVSENVIKTSEEEGDFDRFDLLRGGMKYASKFPLGVGIGNYRTYNTFHYGAKWGTTGYTSAHGTYAQHLAEMGLPGLVLFLAIPISGFIWLKRNYSKIEERLSRMYVLAAMGQLVGITFAAFIGDYIIPTYHNGGIVTFSTTVYSWIIWGIAVAHVRMTRNEEDEPDNGPVYLDR